MTILCPNCGSVAKKADTKYGDRNHCCGLWSWGDGDLADAETHDLRKLAHSSFDPLWKQHGIERKKAYSMLANELGLEAMDCHMKTMGKEYLKMVPMASLSILSKWRQIK